MANYPGCASDCSLETLCMHMTYMPDAADGVSKADVNEDGVVEFVDLLQVLADYGDCF